MELKELKIRMQDIRKKQHNAEINENRKERLELEKEEFELYRKFYKDDEQELKSIEYKLDRINKFNNYQDYLNSFPKETNLPDWLFKIVNNGGKFYYIGRDYEPIVKKEYLHHYNNGYEYYGEYKIKTYKNSGNMVKLFWNDIKDVINLYQNGNAFKTYEEAKKEYFKYSYQVGLFDIKQS